MKKERKTAQLNIRCTELEKKQIISEAENARMPHTHFALQKILNQDSGDIVRENSQKVIRAEVRQELRKIGTNINQLTKYFNSSVDKNPYLKASDRDALNKLYSIISELTQKL